MSKLESALNKIVDDLEAFTMEAENSKTVTISINQHPSILPRRAFSYIIIVGKIMFSKSAFDMYLALEKLIPTYEIQLLMAFTGHEFTTLTGAEIYQQICNLLKKDKDLLQEFRQFISEERTSFDISINKLKKAMYLLDVYRASYPNDNEATKKFLDILQEFQSEIIDATAAIDRCKEGFAGFPYLTYSFNKYLPNYYKLKMMDSSKKDKEPDSNEESD
ncbi:hypothetical protein CHUAL_005310 [Chamberlinius hualienensis]